MYEWVLFANVAVYLAILAYYLKSPCASALHPATFYAAVHGFVFVIRPILVWIGDYTKVYAVYKFTPTMDVKITTIAITALAYVIVMMSLMYFANRPMKFLNIPDDIRKRMQKPILFVFILLAPLCVYALIKGWEARAYDNYTMILAEGGVRINTTGVGYITEAPHMMIPLSLMVAWAFRFKLLSLIPFVAFVFLKAGTGGRGAFIIAAAAMGLLYLYENRRVWPTPRILLLIGASLALFTIVGNDRGAGLRSYIISDEVHDKIGGSQIENRAFLDGMDYANLEYTEYMVRAIPDRTRTYGYFVDNLQLFTEPVPRVLWPGKPIGAPIKMWDLFDYGNPIGMTVSVPGYGWAQLGWLGVIIYSLFIGFALSKIYNAFLNNRHAPLIIIAYFDFLGSTILYIRDGVLLTVFRSQLFYLFPLLLVYLMSRKAHRRVRLLGALGPTAYKQFLADKIAELRRRRQVNGTSGLRVSGRPSAR